MEKRAEVKTVKVTLICDECGGEMKPTGEVYDTYPCYYQYQCEKCGNKVTSQKVYPYVEHRDII